MSVDVTDISDARAAPEEVLGGGFQTTLTEDEVKPHISLAHEMVNDRLAGQLGERLLHRIEILLARHSIRMEPDRQVESEGIGPVSRDYSGDFSAKQLEATAPGQQAMMLDSSDTLGRQTISFFSCNG